ncbi:hypothetical protein PCASD_24483 [Puccinia coronata f. sp. avenae]|uniref:Uncharacterized protein n=1 Tax=Puccinia coronata f. sp. avenae TaxID=200324 RepID=A0A2N5SDW2_9BASI|nr:hypothetical protein PCASD_24483 [Puccinia coronata f. sp. avenae]
MTTLAMMDSPTFQIFRTTKPTLTNSPATPTIHSPARFLWIWHIKLATSSTLLPLLTTCCPCFPPALLPLLATHLLPCPARLPPALLPLLATCCPAFSRHLLPCPRSPPAALPCSLATCCPALLACHLPSARHLLLLPSALATRVLCCPLPSLPANRTSTAAHCTITDMSLKRTHVDSESI